MQQINSAQVGKCRQAEESAIDNLSVIKYIITVKNSSAASQLVIGIIYL